jgi:hypothetical protein
MTSSAFSYRSTRLIANLLEEEQMEKDSAVWSMSISAAQLKGTMPSKPLQNCST